MNNIVSLARDVSDVSFPHDGTNWQTLGYQVDQQRYVLLFQYVNINVLLIAMISKFVIQSSTVRKLSKDSIYQYYITNGYLRFQEGTNVSNVHRMMHQFVAAENVTTNSHNDGITLQAPGNHKNQ